MVENYRVYGRSKSFSTVAEAKQFYENNKGNDDWTLGCKEYYRTDKDIEAVLVFLFDSEGNEIEVLPKLL